MIPFKTTDAQLIRLAWLVVSMKADGIDVSIVADVFRIAITDQGIYDLMELWYKNYDKPHERTRIMQDILAGVRDYRTITKRSCGDHSCASCCDCEDYMDKIYGGT
jgi:hypothetical protein